MDFLDNIMISGGLNHIDDHSVLAEEIHISGGKDEVTSCIIGDNVMYKFRDMIIKWMVFLDEFVGETRKIKSKYIKDLIILIKEIFGDLADDIKDRETLKNFLNSVYRKKNKPFEDLFSHAFELHETIALPVREVFFLWKNHLEDLILKFNSLRTRYIKKYKTGDKINNIKSLMKKWEMLDRKRENNSSSILLLYSLPSSGINKNIKNQIRFVWNISPPTVKVAKKSTKKHADISGKMIKFDKAIRRTNFIYPGFCTLKPIERLRSLMNFPIRELLECIYAFGDDTSKIRYGDIYKKIVDLTQDRSKFPKKKKYDGIKLEKIKKGAKQDKLISIINKIIQKIENKYINKLIRREREYDTIAYRLSIISSILSENL
jgi:hypothetical protein